MVPVVRENPFTRPYHWMGFPAWRQELGSRKLFFNNNVKTCFSLAQLSWFRRSFSIRFPWRWNIWQNSRILHVVTEMEKCNFTGILQRHTPSFPFSLNLWWRRKFLEISFSWWNFADLFIRKIMNGACIYIHNYAIFLCLCSTSSSAQFCQIFCHTYIQYRPWY
jgi:hypothetical protein